MINKRRQGKDNTKRSGNRFRLFGFSKEQEAMLYAAEGCNRLLWNKALAMQKAQLEHGQKLLSYYDFAKFLPVWKTRLPFLCETMSQPLQQTLMALDRAIWDAFDKTDPKRFPTFKKKGRDTGIVIFPQGFVVDEEKARIRLPKIGWVRYRKSKELAGMPKSVTLSVKNGKWYASILTEEGELPSVNAIPSEANSVGIDKGVAKFCAISDGSIVMPLDAFRKSQKKLARLQRKAARQVKFSNNWKKTQHRIALLHEHIANQRNDFIHKQTSALCKNHDIVFAEDLKIRNMTKSAKGTVDNPGTNVAQKRGLNKAILDQGWGEFDRQMAYKMAWKGGVYIKVPAFYTSQACPSCGAVDKENRKTQAKFHCVHCGYSADADVNAAVNIKKRGLALLGEAAA
jgi:putative transposase